MLTPPYIINHISERISVYKSVPLSLQITAQGQYSYCVLLTCRPLACFSCEFTLHIYVELEFAAPNKQTGYHIH